MPLAMPSLPIPLSAFYTKSSSPKQIKKTDEKSKSVTNLNRNRLHFFYIAAKLDIITLTILVNHIRLADLHFDVDVLMFDFILVYFCCCMYCD